MPLLGYSGYLPFGLEVYAAYHFLIGLVPRVPQVSPRMVVSIPENTASVSGGSTDGF